VGRPAWLLSVPYVWYLGHGVGVGGVAVAGGLLVGSLLALFLAGYGLLVSTLARSNRLSLSVSLFALLALYAPTQMPSSVQAGWLGGLLLRADPFAAGMVPLAAAMPAGVLLLIGLVARRRRRLR
jgi:ABC-2 type transport system permease protein